MASWHDEPASFSLDDLHKVDTSGSFDAMEAQPIKAAGASSLALSPPSQPPSLGDAPGTAGGGPHRQPVRIHRVFNGTEVIEFSTELPERWRHHIDPFTYATMIRAMNEILRDARDPVHGLFDNFMTNISFQLWPLIVGTHYMRCMHKFERQLRDFEERILHPLGLELVPLDQTAFLYIDCAVAAPMT